MSRYRLDKALWGGAQTFDTLMTEIRGRADEFGRQHYVSDDIVKRFKEIGIYRAFVPKKYGGDERSPIEFLLAIEAISEADGSAGWVASFGVCESYLGALPMDILEETWKDPDAVFAGAMFPVQPSAIVNGQYQLNGRWKWASGCKSADFMGVGIKPDEEGALPRMAVFVPEGDEIDLESWDVQGMSGSGSFDLLLNGRLVDREWSFIRGGKLSPETPFFNYPTISIATQVLAVTTLGVARAAFNHLVDNASARASATGAPNIGDRSYVQIEMAKADAKIRASRAFFYESIECAWEILMRGDELDSHTVSMMRLSSTHLTRECAEATRMIYQLSGMEAAYYENNLSRYFRDVHMPTQHAFMGEITYQNAGGLFFGKQPLPGYL